MQKKDRILNLILPIITIGCILFLWSVMAVAVNSEYILPSVADTFFALINIFGQVKFYTAFAFTLLRSIIAFTISFVIAGVCAFLAHKSKRAERVVLTVMSVLRALPTISIVLLLLFWTNSQIAPIIVTMLVVMPTTYTHLKSALESVDKTAVEAGLVDGAGKLQCFLRVEFPQIVPAVYSAIGSGVSLNFKLMVAAEVLSVTVKSMGNLLNDAKFGFEIANMLALVITTVAFGIIIEFVFNKLSKKTGEWK